MTDIQAAGETGTGSDGPAREIEVVVEAREAAADGVLSLTLRAAAGRELPAWRPGAHVDLLFGDFVRQYSLCGDPAGPLWRLGVLKDGPGSAYLHDHVQAGDVLRVRGPRNHFPLDDAPRYLFLAGGIGITPILPMIAAADAAGADWRLLYGGRSRDGMAFAGELAGYGDRVTFHVGMLDLDDALGSPDEDTLVYCCGPEPMLAAVEERCLAWPKGALRTERFTPKPVTGPQEALDVELAQTGRTITVPADRSILESIEDAGVPVLSSCREGTCGTCETGVLDGTPDHRDSILSEDERACGDFMMICVSRASTPRLVLDI